MKGILTTFLALCLLISCSVNEKRREKDLNKLEENKLMYQVYFQKKEFEKCLDLLNENISIIQRNTIDSTAFINALDSKHYVLMQLEEWEHALEVGIKLEEFSCSINVFSPWNCLKIADCYIGLNDVENTLYWVSKAVNERDFKNYDYLLAADNYSLVHNNEEFNNLVKIMKLKNAGVGQKAKDFEVKLLDNTIFRLDEKRGKIVLLYFWSTSCKPCINSLPKLIDLQNQFSKIEFEILAISLDKNEKQLKQFLEKNKITLNISCSYLGFKEDPIARLYDVNATPSLWLIDKNGIIQNYNLSYDDLKDAIADLVLYNK